MLARVTQRWVIAQRIADEVGQLGEGFHSGVPGSDEDEGELPLAVGLVRRGRGCFEPAQDVVSQGNRIGEVGEWLRSGDLVKYARVPSGRDEAAAALAQAVTLVERTRPVLAPAPPTPAPSAEPPPGAAS